MPRIVPLMAGIILVIGGRLLAITTTLVTFISPPTAPATARSRPAVHDRTAIASEVEIMRSKSVLYVVATNLQLARKWAEKYKEGGELSMDITYRLLSRQVMIQPSKTSHLIEI